MQIVINARPKVDKKGRQFLKVTSPVAIINPAKRDGVNVRIVEALWDTGATHTSIPMETALELGLPFGDGTKTEMGVSVSASRYCSFYLRFHDGSIMRIPCGVAVPESRRPLVIGMDVMSKGVTTIEPDGQDGVRFTFKL